MSLVVRKKVFGIANGLIRYRCNFLVAPMAFKHPNCLRYDISMGRIVVHHRLRVMDYVWGGIRRLALQQGIDGGMRHQLRNSNTQNGVLHIILYNLISPVTQFFGSYGACLEFSYQLVNPHTSLIHGIWNLRSLRLITFFDIARLYYHSYAGRVCCVTNCWGC